MGEEDEKPSKLSRWWRSVRSALLEVVFIGVMSLVPLLVGALKDAFYEKTSENLSRPFISALLSGQLIFYALGFVSTVFWLSAKDYSSGLPGRPLVQGSALLCYTVAVIFLSIDPSLDHPRQPAVAYVSLAVYFVSAFLYLLMATIGNVDEIDVRDAGRDSEIEARRRLLSLRKETT